MHDEMYMLECEIIHDLRNGINTEIEEKEKKLNSFMSQVQDPILSEGFSLLKEWAELQKCRAYTDSMIHTMNKFADIKFPELKIENSELFRKMLTLNAEINNHDEQLVSLLQNQISDPNVLDAILLVTTMLHKYNLIHNLGYECFFRTMLEQTKKELKKWEKEPKEES